jgi:MoaA/NifB/PqqE/SkfB family radical SAM enzyme
MPAESSGLSSRAIVFGLNGNSSPELNRLAAKVATYASAKAETIASFAAFTRGEVAAPKYPVQVYLEVSNLCNAKCVMCGVFSAFNPDRLEMVRVDERGHMLHIDDVLADEDLLAHALVVHLFGYGEPTIHPRFRELLRRVAEYEVIVDFITNGMKLQDELIDTLIEAKTERISVSFSGSTKEAYESVYIGCEWGRVLGGLARLRDRKRKVGARFPEVYINSIGWAHHLATLEQFVTLMADHGVSVIEVKQLLPVLPHLDAHVGRTTTEADLEGIHRARATAEKLGTRLYLHHGLDEIRPAREEPAREFLPIERFRDHASTVKLRKGNVVPLAVKSVAADVTVDVARSALGSRTSSHGFHCMEPFQTLYIRQNGLTKPCCFSGDNAMALGNVAEQPGTSVWSGPGHQAIRTASLESDYPELTCGACLRSKDGPRVHYVEYLLYRYNEWYQAVFGEPPAVSAGPIVADAASIAALQRARVGLEAALTDANGDSLFEGYVDVLCSDYVDGWVWCPRRAELRLPVSIHVDGALVGTVVARDPRSDVEAAGRGDGNYGFRHFFSDGKRPHHGQRVAVSVGNQIWELGRSPLVLGLN